MWIKRVQLRNFGCHEDFEQDFVCGLVGIFGPNGSGKSTITDGIYACLTGDWSRFAGVKTDNIRDTAEDDEPSFIAVTAEHAGTEFTITRHLRPSKQELRVTGESEKITRSGDIQHRLSELGVDSKLIGTYVFVSQWNMFDFISKTPGERAKTYQHLCNTSEAQDIVDAVDKLLEQDAHLTVELVDNSDEIRKDIAELSAQRKEHFAAYRAAIDRMLDEEELAAARWNIEQFTKREDAKIALADREAKLITERIRKKQIGVKLKKQESQLRQTEIGLKAATEARDRYADLRCQWQEYSQYLTDKNYLESQLTALQAEERKAPPSYTEEQVQAAADAVAEARAAESRINKIVDTITEDGVTNCESCGQSISEIDVDATLKELEAACHARTEAEAKLHRIQQAVKAYQQYARWREDRERRLAKAQSDLDELVELSEPADAYHEPQAAELAAAHAELTTRFAELSAEVRTLKDEYLQVEATVETLTKLKLELEETIGDRDEALDRKLVAQCDRELKQHAEAEADAKVAKRLGKDVRLRKEKRQKELDTLLSTLEKNRRALTFASKLKAIKKVFHRQMLPRIVATENLEDMEGAINESLSLFGDPFYVQAKDDLSFDVYFPSEPPRDASRISGGQKGVLAISFRKEVAHHFSDEMGMMCLDEPTAGMDEENVMYLQQALAHYASQLQGENQVIMITHSQQLKSAFEQVIELTPYG